MVILGLLHSTFTIYMKCKPSFKCQRFFIKGNFSIDGGNRRWMFLRQIQKEIWGRERLSGGLGEGSKFRAGAALSECTSYRCASGGTVCPGANTASPWPPPRSPCRGMKIVSVKKKGCPFRWGYLFKRFTFIFKVNIWHNKIQNNSTMSQKYLLFSFSLSDNVTCAVNVTQLGFP